MYRYIAMICLRGRSKSQLDRAENALRAHVKGIGGLLAVEIERNLQDAQEACHLCMNLLFDGEASMEAYLAGARHRALWAKMEPITAQRTTAMYPVRPPTRQMPRLYAVIGPSNRDRDTLGRLLDAGMSGIRASLEHHSIEEAMAVLDELRQACESRKAACEVLLDPFTNLRLSEYIRRTGATGLILPLPESTGMLRDLRALLGPSIRLLCKVDCQAHIEALPKALHHTDEVIIARSGMGRNLPRHALPGVQRQVTMACRAAGKPFMIATDLLLTMRDRPFPSAAELGDIHNAVREGAASLMLNDEVAVGRYPVEAMETLRKAAEAALAQH